ncbi:aminotransferase class I/II-fold pyridoxal phosphate-dependent enzyme [Dactylosporangium vinaceum]|uniref:cysteine-S-conjugate beta-lyase n=1 Tax=Dactylosporangium vinaceum TaxID=53362 RepID=A0ABV5MD40_9ACTN|nr:aminotransferase class I/II-fold pyridoxal phosphate-dependent enzyme [Dactylosporangium vinaceum]UAC00829.1 aminotransferase class I/II-fold pyridoxal phosphate-dependent enzyme [Dactylosporangium vinaceum]
MPTFRPDLHALSATATAPGATPLWLAEMTFAPAACITAALVEYATGGNLSYAAGFEFATESHRQWARRRYGWPTETWQYRWYSGVLHATACTVLALTEPTDAVVVPSPAYPPMLRLVPELGRRLVLWPLRPDPTGRYQADLTALATLLERERPGLLILNSPHNPTGRVFRPEEHRAIAALIADAPVHVLSDEVFADIVYTEARHVPFAQAVGATVRARTVTVMSASKTFNVAGVKCAAAIAGSEPLAHRLGQVSPALTGTTSVAGAVASAAAWDGGADWLDRTRSTLQTHRDLLFEALRDRVPHLHGHPPEGTYMAWLTARGTLAETGDVHGALLRTARVDLADGTPFGERSRTRVRMSFACSRPSLEAALDAIAAAGPEWC